MRKIQIQAVDLEQLIPYARNARQHSEQQVAKIAGSIREFGWCKPIVIDGERGVLAGHGALLAAYKLKTAGAKIPNWPDVNTVPVMEVSHLTDAQKRAYILADNRIAEDSVWDDEQLRCELSDIKAMGLVLDVTGFSPADLEEMAMDVKEMDFPELATGDKNPFQQMTFTLHDEQAAVVKDALERAKAAGPFDEGLNANSNGNALARVCEAYR